MENFVQNKNLYTYMFGQVGKMKIKKKREMKIVDTRN